MVTSRPKKEKIKFCLPSGETEPCKTRNSVEALKEQFLTAARLRGSADATIHSYNTLLTTALCYVPDEIAEKVPIKWTQKDIDRITANIQNGVNQKNGKALAPKTVETYLRNFRVFVKWSVDNGYMKKNLAVTKYKAPQAAPKVYTDEEIRILLTEPTRIDSFFEIRNFSMLVTLSETGVRKRSLINIRLCDVDMVNNKITIVRSKNGDVYTVGFTDFTKKWLKKYIDVRTNVDTDILETDVLFCDEYQRQLTESGISSIMKKYVTSKGVKYRGIHAFRHYCATAMVKHGATVAEVALQTGHKDLRQVEGYVHTFKSMPQDKLNKFSPLVGIV